MTEAVGQAGGQQAETLRKAASSPATRRTATRYAIRHQDGRWLVLGYQAGRVAALWTDRAAGAWSWPSMTDAVCAALGVEGLGVVGKWHVEAV